MTTLKINVDSEWDASKLTFESEWYETKKTRILRPLYNGKGGVDVNILLYSEKFFKAPWGLSYKEQYKNDGNEKTTLAISVDNPAWVQMVNDVQNASIRHLVKHASKLLPWAGKGVNEDTVRNMLWNFGLDDDDNRMRKEQKSASTASAAKKNVEVGKYPPMHRLKVLTDGPQVTRVFTESGAEMEIEQLPHKTHFGSTEKVGFSVRVFVRLPYIYLINNKCGNSWSLYQAQYRPYSGFNNSESLFGPVEDQQDSIALFQPTQDETAPEDRVVDQEKMLAMAMAASQSTLEEEDSAYVLDRQTPSTLEDDRKRPPSPVTCHQPEFADEEIAAAEEKRAAEMKRKFANSGGAVRSIVKEPATKKSRSVKN